MTTVMQNLSFQIYTILAIYAPFSWDIFGIMVEVMRRKSFSYI